MAIIKLLVSLNGRENGEKRTITPGYYNTEGGEFPEMLRGETRANVVELPEGFVWEEVVEEEAASDPEEEIADTEETEERPVRRKKKRV